MGRIKEIPWQFLLGDSFHCRPVGKNRRDLVELEIYRETEVGGDVILYCPQMGDYWNCKKRKHLREPSCRYTKMRIEKKSL